MDLVTRLMVESNIRFARKNQGRLSADQQTQVAAAIAQGNALLFAAGPEDAPDGSVNWAGLAAFMAVMIPMIEAMIKSFGG